MRCGEPPAPGYTLELGKAGILKEGRDVSLVGYGRPMNDALAVAEELEGDGISVEVIDLRTVVPMDEATIFASVAKTGRAVVLHEAVKKFGTGAEISSRIHEELFSELKGPVVRLGAKNAPVPYAKHLEDVYIWSKASIEAAIRQAMR